MPNRPTLGKDDQFLEHLRLWTREQYESEWRQIGADPATYTFTHELGEIPWIVDVLYSDNSDGKGTAVPTTFTPAIAKTERTITVRKTDSAAHYFKVRAM